MNEKLTPLAVLVTLVLALPVPSFAFGIPGIGGGGPSVGSGSQVVGWSHSTLPIATPGNVSQAASWTASTINSQIIKVGRALSDIGQSNTAAISKLFESQNDMIKAVNQEMGQSRTAVNAMSAYGPTSRSVLGCGSVKTASAAAYTVSAAKAGAKAYTASVNTYSRSASSHRDAYRMLNQVIGKPGQRVGATDLFGGQNGVVTPARCVAVNGSGATPGTSGAGGKCQDASFAVALINPLPRPTLAAPAAGTPAGKQYRVLRRLELSELSLPTMTLSQVHSWHTANVPVPSSIRKMWVNDQMPPTVPWNAKGLVSPDSLLNAQIALRYEDPTWMRTLNGQDDAYALMREIAMNQAIGLEVSRRRLVLLEYIASMMAGSNAHAVRVHLGPQLDHLYQAAESQKASR